MIFDDFLRFFRVFFGLPRLHPQTPENGLCLVGYIQTPDFSTNWGPKGTPEFGRFGIEPLPGLWGVLVSRRFLMMKRCHASMMLPLLDTTKTLGQTNCDITHSTTPESFKAGRIGLLNERDPA
jgi:hypothetical protein